MTAERRYVIVGAGAVGAALAAALYDAGAGVILVSRGATYRAIESHGLLFTHDGRERRLPIETASGASEVELRDGDVIIFATKTQDVAHALAEWARQPVGGRTAGEAIPAVTVQNGLDAERSALRHFSHVLSGTTLIGAVHTTPGVVEVRNAPKIGQFIVGPEPATDPRSAAEVPRIAEDLRSGGWLVHETVEPRRWKIWKALQSVVFPVDVFAGSDDERAQLRALIKEEAADVLRRSGYEADSPLAELSYDPSLAAISGTGTARLSTWQSFERGTSSEVDYLNGEVVLRARLLGLQVPYNRAVQTLLAAAEAAGEKPGARSFADVLAAPYDVV